MFDHDFTGKSAIYYICCSGTDCSPWVGNIHQPANVGEIASCPHNHLCSATDTRIVQSIRTFVLTADAIEQSRIECLRCAAYSLLVQQLYLTEHGM